MSSDDDERRRAIKGMKAAQATGCGIVLIGFLMFIFLGNALGRKWENTILLSSVGVIGLGVLVITAGAAGRWIEE